MRSYGTKEDLEEIDLEEALSDTGSGNLSQLIVYNDDHNTFEWVIQCFIEVLGHTPEQAEQLSLIIHFKGKATVKTAPFQELKPPKDALIDRGLSAVIEGGEGDQ
jgi:ATP-dependent Clp protease adaptor protein ClpS